MNLSHGPARGLLVAALLALSGQASAFCGFYVGKADTKLFNKASKVVVARDEDKTVITMSNDYQGELKEFAMVVPVPEVLQRKQINIGEQGVLDHLDAYSAPRLAEYFDQPCRMAYPKAAMRRQSSMVLGTELDESFADTTVKIEASYTVGEYDILILSAEQSDGLQRWLEGNGYKVPAQAKRVLGSYLKQDMKFFVAKVNLDEQGKSGFQNLRPLQIAFKSRKFMLPIRLGTVNSDGDQELFVFTLTKKGRVETTNYRTVKLPSNKEIPQYIKEKGEFAKFYKAMFDNQVKKENGRAVFLEYAWDMNWCDPCAANPLSTEQLRKLGVWWVKEGSRAGKWNAGARPVYVTRMHLRYNGETFPEDLMFQVTNNKRNFQGRYVIRNRWDPQKHPGRQGCDPAGYWKRRAQQEERYAQNLANLTGWDINEIRRRQGPLPQGASGGWVDNLWDD